MRFAFALIAAGFLAVAAAFAFPAWLAGLDPDLLGLGLLLAGFALAFLGAVIARSSRRETAQKPPKISPGRGLGPLSSRRIPAEGGTSPYGDGRGATDV